MAYRDVLRRNAAGHLAPGERIQAIFPAQTISGLIPIISSWRLLISGGMRIVVVTDRRILVCRTGRAAQYTVREVERELPRTTRIGPPVGAWYETEALGEKLYVSPLYHRDVVAADDAIGAGP